MRQGGNTNGTERQLLEAGLDHHRAGHLGEAARHYADLLKIRPLHPDALHLLGVIARQQQDPDTSERLILAAVAQNPKVATFHHQLGKTYASQGKTEQAEQHYRCALSLNPGDVDSLQLLAAAVGAAGKWEEAIAFYTRLLQWQPGKAEFLYGLGHALGHGGRASEALFCYRQAVALYPDAADAHFNLGKLLFATGQRPESVACFRRVVVLQPEDAEAYNHLGQALHELGEADEARQMYLEALRLRPDFIEVLSNLGALFMDLAELGMAEQLLRRAVQLAPDFRLAETNLGSVLARQGRFVEAFEVFRAILTADPTHALTLCSMGYSLDALGDLGGARECFELALATEPTSALLRFNLSSHLLLAGNFDEGWACYEQRWALRQFTGKMRPYPQPRWQGEEPAGASIFLWAEQGLGDTLQFIRYALLLVERGARVVLEVQSPLYALLRGLHPKIHVFGKDQEGVPSTDWHCPLLSLPKIFSTDLGSIPATVPYLYADREKVKHWAGRIRSPDLKVGVVWRGNPEHVRDRLRSIPFEQFCHVMRLPGVCFYSLQKGQAAVQAEPAAAGIDCHDLDPLLLDFSDTAAAVANLDLVITVDTSVAHLAGAMGKPVWILLAHAPDWRWLTERDDSPWYPTARLFRQPSPGQWASVLDQVKCALHALVPEACAGVRHREPGQPC